MTASAEIANTLVMSRGLVATPTPDGVLVSWRLFEKDPEAIHFELRRNGTIVHEVLTDNATNWLDTTGDRHATYTLRSLVAGKELDRTKARVWREPFLRIPLQPPAPGKTPNGDSYSHTPNDIGTGDLDGDGEYEFVIKWEPTNAKDNSQPGYTGETYFDAYELNGDLLWRINLGHNIRSGAHYTPFLVYDFDGDGCAEFVCRTADGTCDGDSVVLGNSKIDHRQANGYVLDGPEFLTVFNGKTGTAMASMPYIPPRGRVEDWGDNYGNRVDRFLAGVAYLDGHHPSMVFSRGYYARTVVAAIDWRNNKLRSRWTFDSHSGEAGDLAYAGQGAHSLSVADVDDDGKDEILFGAATIDNDGTGLYSTRLGHGDALHVGDLSPQRPGLEVFMVHEDPSAYGNHGIEMHAAESGKILWSSSGGGRDVGRGLSCDIDPRYSGAECWASRGDLMTATGAVIGKRKPPMNFALWWDGDPQRELLDKTTVSKWDCKTEQLIPLLEASKQGAQSNNWTKATPALSADLLGDWREEVIWRHADNKQLLLFTTPCPTTIRLPTLMDDRQYRVAIAWQNVGYNQPPHPSYDLALRAQELNGRQEINTNDRSKIPVAEKSSSLAP